MIDPCGIKILQDLLHLSGIGDLIQIAENDDVLIPAVLQAAPHSVLLEGIPVMGITGRRILHHHMDDLVGEFGKHLFVLFIIQRLRIPGKGLRSLADHEPVHHRVHDMKPQLQDIQFIEKLKAIVYHNIFLL